MSVRGIDHIGVTVPDIDAATEFFARAFGAEVLYDTLPREADDKSGPDVAQRLGVPHETVQRAIRMLALPGGPGLELFEFTGPRQRDPAIPADLGWQHVAFYTDDLDAAIEAVTAAGGELLADPKPLPSLEAGPRNRFAYLRAPWGATIELLTYPDPQPYTEQTDLRRWRP